MNGTSFYHQGIPAKGSPLTLSRIGLLLISGMHDDARRPAGTTERRPQQGYAGDSHWFHSGVPGTFTMLPPKGVFCGEFGVSRVSLRVAAQPAAMPGRSFPPEGPI